MLDNNLKVLDLTGLVSEFPRDITETTELILSKTEQWEFSLTKNSESDPLRYPTVAINNHGPRPDNKYYLY